MPWDLQSVEKHNKGLNDKQKKQWVEVANSVLQKCMADGGSEESCAASAIRQANGVVSHSEMSYITHKSSQNTDFNVEVKQHQGASHLVMPVVMMIEGVHNGSHGPIFHSIAELGKFPQAWDGRPVVIDHPEIDGQHVSANSPEIIDQQTVGRIYNTKIDGNKLVAEAWLNEEKLRQLSVAVLNAIKSKKPVEVSLGLFSEEDYETGEWNGETYKAIARNHRPDHLALLPDSVGACSLKDGCGLGVNETKGGLDMDVNAVVTGMEEKRKELGMSVSEFYAVPRDPPSESKLPIFDVAHVRNAMARFSQTQELSAEEKASAKSKIIAKAKHFGIDIKGFADVEGNEENKGEILLENLQDGLKGIDENINSMKDTVRIMAEGSGLRRTRFINSKKEVMANEGCTPCIKKKVDEMIANSNGKFAENDREWLESLTEARLEQIKPTIVEVEKTVEVNVLTDAQKAALAYGEKLLKEKREVMVKGIQDNAGKENWPDEVLVNMDESMLERVFKSVKKAKEEVVDYSLQGTGANLSANECKEEPLLPAGIKFRNK
jgi:hypothetical protein